SSHFFFLFGRPLHRSTLFPYTTLFRSQRFRIPRALEGLPQEKRALARRQPRRPKEVRQSHFLYGPPGRPGGVLQMPQAFRIDRRSEEHTSELQSLRHLVCRLLLEKKKT